MTTHYDEEILPEEIDAGDMAGNTGYYGYGFDIRITDAQA